MQTDLEKKQSDTLYNVVKEKYKKPHIKDIDGIIHHMSESLYHDDRVNDIYSKTTISQDVLHKLFVKNKDTPDTYSQLLAKKNEEIIENADKTINYTLEKYKPRPKKSCCSICYIQ
jgi:hypothetical protein